MGTTLDDGRVDGVGDDGWVFRYLDPMPIDGHPAGELAGAYVTVGMVMAGDILSMSVRLEVGTEAHREPDYITPARAADTVCEAVRGASCLRRGLIQTVQVHDLAWYPVNVYGEETPEPPTAPPPTITEADGWERVSTPVEFRAEVGITAADGTVVALAARDAWVSRDGGGEWARLEGSAVDWGDLGGDDYLVFWADIAMAEDGTLVAVGSARHTADDIPLALVSLDDGRSWTARAVDDVGSASHVEWSGGWFVAAGVAASDATVWRSADGKDWTWRPFDYRSDQDPGFSGVAVGPAGELVAIEGAGGGVVSLVWQPGLSEPGSYVMPFRSQALAAGESGFYAIGHDGSRAVLLTSEDGADWIVDPRSSVFQASGDILGDDVRDIHVAADGRIVMAGFGAGGSGAAVWIAESPDSPFV